jgi:hypothetical protein
MHVNEMSSFAAEHSSKEVAEDHLGALLTHPLFEIVHLLVVL